MYRFLDTYGPPDEILGDFDSRYSSYNADLYLVYEEEHIVAVYYFWGSDTIGTVNLCLQELSPGTMYLWAPGLELNQDFSVFTPVDEVSEFSPGIFYEHFVNKNHQCFETSKSAWK